MKSKILGYIKTWEQRGYSDGIPDEAPARLEQLNKVGSYRMICMAIMKNDVCLETLGFSKTKSNVYHEIKRSDLISRGKLSNQLKINFYGCLPSSY